MADTVDTLAVQATLDRIDPVLPEPELELEPWERDLAVWIADRLFERWERKRDQELARQLMEVVP